MATLRSSYEDSTYCADYLDIDKRQRVRDELYKTVNMFAGVLEFSMEIILWQTCKYQALLNSR